MTRALVSIATIATASLIACTSATPEEQAMLTAQEGYEHLVAGDYEAFLEARAGMDSIPPSYREQLLTSYKQFMFQQRIAHQDIVGVQATRVQMDSVQHQMQVFLLINYADSTQEEIVVPMVEQDDCWKLK